MIEINIRVFNKLPAIWYGVRINLNKSKYTHRLKNKIIEDFNSLKLLGLTAFGVFFESKLKIKPPIIEIIRNRLKEPKAGGLFSIHRIADISRVKEIPQ